MVQQAVTAEVHQANVEKLIEKLNWANAVLVGAAAGMSASCGYNFFYTNDEWFERYLGEFARKYGYTGIFNGFYYRYPSSEARWAFLARSLCLLYETPVGSAYLDLMKLLDGKTYHVMTTNQDFQFTHVVPDEKLSAIQGDWRYFQCSHRCHDALYFNKETVYRMNAAIDENLCIPTELIPHCPRCGAEMEPWVRGYTFLEGAKYHEEYRKIQKFLDAHRNQRILFLELGVGRMTPMFIQEPFWNLTYQLPNAFYMTINPKDALLPREIAAKGHAIHEDIAAVLRDAVAQG